MQLPLLITSRDRALKAMQEIQLDGLMEIDRICRKHGIKYSLGGGTCLGQVRHGGFIPWDDDIDVDMTLENYDKFMAIAPEELDSSRFHLFTRKTDPNIFRSSARLGIVGTELSLPNWEKVGRSCNIFVDIFRWNYLPDDEEKRKEVTTKLFLIHCIQHYKETGAFAAQLDPDMKLRIKRFGNSIPASLLEKYEDRLIHYAKGRTGWIIDDAIIHGAHMGYPSDGSDEYIDVKFEGRTVMGKKDPTAFLRTLYGEHYMEWLPPEKRISHHSWTKFDLGKYASDYGLDESYKDFMTVKHSPARLKQMKTVSKMIVEKVADVCENYNINYAIAHLNEKGINIKGVDIEEIWTRPDIVMMLREDYEKFAQVCEKEFGKQYIYQSHATNPEYYFDYARVHLNYTRIRDKRLRVSIEKEIETGFFIKIIPLDNYYEGDDMESTLKMLRFWRRSRYSRWKTRDAVQFRASRFKDKVKLMSLRRYSLDDMCKKVDHYAQLYNDRECEKCYDSSHQLSGIVLDKKDVLENRVVEIDRDRRHAETMEELIHSIQRHYGACHLTYYDIPDWQLSILRYDEKNDRLLTNEEIMASD